MVDTVGVLTTTAERGPPRWERGGRREGKGGDARSRRREFLRKGEREERGERRVNGLFSQIYGSEPSVPCLLC